MLQQRLKIPCATTKTQLRQINKYATTWMGLEIVILNEVSQIEKQRYHMTSFILEFRKKLHKRTYKTEIDVQT